MQPRVLVLAVVLVTLVTGCRSKKSKCEKFARNATAFGTLLGAAMIDGLKDDPDAPNRLKECAERKGSVDTIGDCLFEDGAERDAMLKKAVEFCMQLPDDMVDCLSDWTQLDSPKCMQAYRDMEGLVDETPGGVGPAAAWRYPAGEEIWDVAATAAGHVMALEETLVGLTPEGKQAWRAAPGGQPTGLAVAIDDANVLVTSREGKILALEAATGKPRWTVELAANDDGDPPAATAAGKGGDKWVLYLSNRRLADLEPGACAKAPDACLRVIDEPLPETWDSISDLVVGPDGTRWVIYLGSLVVVDARGEHLFGLQAKDLLGAPAFVQDRVILAVDDRLAELVPARCRGADMNARLDALPEGCVVRTTRIEKLDAERPVLSGETILTSANGVVVAVAGGKVKWKTDIGADGAPVFDGGKLYAVSGWTIDTPTQLRALDPGTGRTRWASSVQTGKSFLTGSYPVVTDGQILVVAKKSVTAFARPRK